MVGWLHRSKISGSKTSIIRNHLGFCSVRSSLLLGNSAVVARTIFQDLLLSSLLAYGYRTVGWLNNCWIMRSLLSQGHCIFTGLHIYLKLHSDLRRPLLWLSPLQIADNCINNCFSQESHLQSPLLFAYGLLCKLRIIALTMLFPRIALAIAFAYLPIV